MSQLTGPLLQAAQDVAAAFANLQSVLPAGSAILAPSDATDIANTAASLETTATGLNALATQLGFVAPTSTVSGGAGTDTTGGAAAAS